MAAAFKQLVANTSYSSASAMYAGDVNAATGDGWVSLLTWGTADQTAAFLDDDASGTLIAKYKHTGINRWIAAGYRYNVTANAALGLRATLASAEPTWSLVGALYSGLKTAATPFVAYTAASASAATTVTAANVDPGAAGIVIALGANDADQAMLAGAGFTLRGGTAWGWIADKIVTGAGNVAASMTAGASDSLLILSAAFIDSGGGGSGSQRVRCTGVDASSFGKTGLSGYVWSTSGSTRYATFSGVSIQASLDGSGRAYFFIDATGLGLSNGANLMVVAKSATQGIVGYCVGTVEAGAA